MKNIIKLSYLAMAAVAMLGLASCGDDIADYEPASLLPATCHGLYFESTEGEDEVEPEASAIARIAVMRMDSTEAHTYNVKVLENQDGVFTVPATVSFEAGKKEATIEVDYSKAGVGITYELQLTFDDDDINPYKPNHVFTYSVTRVKWDEVGTGYWVDGNISRFFNVQAVPLIVEIQKNVSVDGKEERYRFNSPFAYVFTKQDENGAYDGYPYSEAGDVDNLEHKFVITVTGTNASLAPVELGMDYGYGMFSVGQVYGYASNNLASYPLGVYSEADGTITFPAKSLYVSMASYNGGGRYPSNSPSYLYLSKEAYVAANTSAE